jgi:hypothetical protein
VPFSVILARVAPREETRFFSRSRMKIDNLDMMQTQ